MEPIITLADDAIDFSMNDVAPDVEALGLDLEPEDEEEKASAIDTFWEWQRLNSVESTVVESLIGERGYFAPQVIDPNFNVDLKLLQETGIPSERWNEALVQAESPSMFASVAERIKQEMRLEQMLADQGTLGAMGTVFAAELTDPAQVGLAMASGGATGFLQAAAVARKAPLIARAIRGGSQALGVALPTEALRAHTSELMDGWDALQTAGMAAVIGGPLGMLGRTPAELAHAEALIARRRKLARSAVTRSRVDRYARNQQRLMREHEMREAATAVYRQPELAGQGFPEQLSDGVVIPGVMRPLDVNVAANDTGRFVALSARGADEILDQPGVDASMSAQPRGARFEEPGQVEAGSEVANDSGLNLRAIDGSLDDMVDQSEVDMYTSYRGPEMVDMKTYPRRLVDIDFASRARDLTDEMVTLTGQGQMSPDGAAMSVLWKADFAGETGLSVNSLVRAAKGGAPLAAKVVRPDDSAGAARTAPQNLGPDPTEISQTTSADRADQLTSLGTVPKTRAEMTAFEKILSDGAYVVGTIANVIKRSPSALHRAAGDKLVEDGLGGLGDQVASAGGSASQLRARLAGQAKRRAMTTTEPLFQKWLKNNPASWIDVGKAIAKTRFNELVGEAVYTGRGSPEILTAAKAWTDELYKLGKELEARGMANFFADANRPWLPRVFNLGKVKLFDNQYGNTQMVGAIKAAIEAAQPGIKPAKAEGMAYAYWYNLQELGADVLDDLDLFGKGNTQKLLADAKVKFLDNPDAYDALEDFIKRREAAAAKKQATPDPTDINFSRLQFDEAMTHRMFNTLTQQWDEVPLYRLFDNNIETVAGNYIEKANGWLAIHDKFKDVVWFTQAGTRRVGIKTEDDFMGFLEDARRQASDSGTLTREFERAEEDLILSFKSVIGRSTETIMGRSSEEAATIGRLARMYGHIRYMGQAGVAAASELGNTIAFAGFKTLYDQMPVIAQLANDIIRGRYTASSKLAEDLLVLSSTANHRLLDSINLTMRQLGEDTYRLDNSSALVRRLNQGLSTAATLVNRASLMHAVTDFASSVTTLTAAQRFYKQAVKGTGGFSAARLRDAGLSQDMADRIFAQMRRYSKPSQYRSDVLDDIGLERWDDREAREAFGSALFSITRRVVMQNDVGTTTRWQHGTTGKLILQLRSFVIGAHSKLMLNGIKHHDSEALLGFMGTMLLGGLGWAGQTMVRAQFTEDPEEYLEERLSGTNKYGLATWSAAAFQRSGYSALMPMLTDSALGLASVPAMFGQTRSSGQESNLLGGMPAFSAAKGINALLKVPAAMMSEDLEMAQEDYRAIGALTTNAFFISNAIGALGNGAPRAREADQREWWDE